MTQDEIIEMARQAGFGLRYEGRGQISSAPTTTEKLEAFAKLVAAKEREHYEDALVQICIKCRSNEWGPLTHKKEILSWFHDFAANTLERGEA